MKLYSDIINKDFDYKVEEVDIVEEDLEEILLKLVLSSFGRNSDFGIFFPNLLQLCKLLH